MVLFLHYPHMCIAWGLLTCLKIPWTLDRMQFDSFNQKWKQCDRMCLYECTWITNLSSSLHFSYVRVWFSFHLKSIEFRLNSLIVHTPPPPPSPSQCTRVCVCVCGYGAIQWFRHAQSIELPMHMWRSFALHIIQSAVIEIYNASFYGVEFWRMTHILCAVRACMRQWL